LKEIILIGGGGHCKSCIDVIELQNEFKIAGILDNPEKKGESVLGYEIIGSDADLPLFAKENKYFLITVGQIGLPEVRKKIIASCENLKMEFPAIISPIAHVSKNSFIGKGTIIMHNAIVNAGSRVGEHCIINTKALLEHDVIVEDYCHIATGAILNGGTFIGNESFIGSSAVSKQGSTVAPKSFVKANSTFK